MARKPDSGAGKKRLLESAQAVFADRTYAEVGIAEIVKRSEFQAPTIYYHFTDKEGLYVAWCESAFERLGRAIQRMAPSPPRYPDSLNAFATALLTSLDFDLRQTLRDGEHLQRPASQEQVAAAYMRHVYEPAVALLVQGIKQPGQPIARITDAFLGGLLALRKPYAAAAVHAEAAIWWCDSFRRAFEGRSLG